MFLIELWTSWLRIGDLNRWRNILQLQGVMDGYVLDWVMDLLLGALWVQGRKKTVLMPDQGREEKEV